MSTSVLPCPPHDGSLTIHAVLAEVKAKYVPPEGTTHFCYAFRKFYWLRVEEWKEPPPALSTLEEYSLSTLYEHVSRRRELEFNKQTSTWDVADIGFRRYPISELPSKLLDEAQSSFNELHGISN